MSLEMINSMGQTMLKESIEYSTNAYHKKANISDFSKGLYFINLRWTNSIITHKLIILQVRYGMTRFNYCQTRSG
ncbi:MAG: T9SS type A sorting domain-containing protein [Bacteroidetes bacterium]|nr:T9SS type A sorting domain-containing protein [Bacteroidota bacterium]